MLKAASREALASRFRRPGAFSWRDAEWRSSSLWLVPSLCLAKDSRKGAPPEGEALLNVARDRNLCAVAGNSIALAEDPHGSSAVIYLEDAASKSAKRFADSPGYGDLFVGVSSGVSIDVLDRCARGATRE